MPVPVIDIDQMRQWEQATWASGITEAEVIGKVGQAVAVRALQLTQSQSNILILAGRGHNGDDARAAVGHLHDRKVTLIDVFDPAAAQRQLADQAKKWSLIIDGLFGIGLNRPLNDSWRSLLSYVNGLRVAILSIDVPSGWNASSGHSEGAAIDATITLTVGAPKKGLLSPAAAQFVGRLEVADDVGLVTCAARSELQWILPKDFADMPPPRHVTGHKGSFGHALIFAGSLGYHGAAVLSARGALRAQPGLVTVFTEERVYLPVASQLQQPMVHPWLPGKPLPGSKTAIAFGPGLAALDFSPALQDELRLMWSTSPLPVIADASALAWLPSGSQATDALRVITPHPGEAARMLNISTNDVQQERLATVRMLSQKYGNCVVVLKGHQTLIGRSSGQVLINSSGNPHLAQGGSGDVLLGYLSGLIAQPALQTNSMHTIAYGVWQHGAAADRLTAIAKNWNIDDLLQNLGNTSPG